MLKKILSIFFILCLVLILAVPCFAQDIGRPVYYNQLAKFTGFRKYSVGSSSSVTYNSETDSYHLYFAASGYQNSFNTLMGTVIGPGRFLIIIPATFSSNKLLVAYSGAGHLFSTYNNSLFYHIFDYQNNITDIRLQATSEYDIDVYDFYFINLSLIYDDPSSVTIQSFLSDFPFFADTGVSFTSNSYFNPSVNDGFSKMLSFTHVFDRIPYFFDQYTTVTVWIVGSVSLSIVILVIVFMIKRFSGGNS